MNGTQIADHNVAQLATELERLHAALHSARHRLLRDRGGLVPRHFLFLRSRREHQLVKHGVAEHRGRREREQERCGES